MENINDLSIILIPVLISLCSIHFGMKILRFLFSHYFDVYLDDEDLESELEDIHIDFHNSNKDVTKDDIDEDIPIRYFK